MTRAHVITGSFGSGKTTAIRWLMAHKPENELWMVILNEFTDAGLDAVSVAEAARGRYDVRLVAGGCLCCVGAS
jgi:G3E family GTPase